MATVMTPDDATLNALTDVSFELGLTRARLEHAEAKVAQLARLAINLGSDQNTVRAILDGTDQ